MVPGYLPALVSQIRRHQFPCSVNLICTCHLLGLYIKKKLSIPERTLVLLDIKLEENQHRLSLLMLEKLGVILRLAGQR